MASGGSSTLVERRLLTEPASLLLSMGSWVRGLQNCGSRALAHRLSSCVAQALLLCSMWDLPRSEIALMSPALAGRFLTTEPPGKPKIF